MPDGRRRKRHADQDIQPAEFGLNPGTWSDFFRITHVGFDDMTLTPLARASWAVSSAWEVGENS